MAADFDVTIIGGGPAGSASAIVLADFAPELRVCMVADDAGTAPIIGETVPPPIQPVLRHLGVLHAFLRDGHCPSYRTLSAWGSSAIASNEFLFHTEQIGWRLDRGKFDRLLRRRAALRLARRFDTRARGLTACQAGWRVECANGESLTTRFAIDATGRTARFARKEGLRPTAMDRLVGCSVRLEGSDDQGEGLVVESFAAGWWYTAVIPGARRVIVCMTDADQARRLGLPRPKAFAALLERTEHVRTLAAGGRVEGDPKLWPAYSSRPAGPVMAPIVSVGDALCCFDPIAGQGILKALRSGVFAAYAVADWLRGGDESGLERYWALAKREFDVYWTWLGEFYMIERRWRDLPFWFRRHRNGSSDHAYELLSFRLLQSGVAMPDPAFPTAQESRRSPGAQTKYTSRPV